jgi:hypothetical protein
MKKLNLLLTLLFISLSSYVLSAQTIDAAKISQLAKEGKDLRYENATISGVLDLTPYEEKKSDLPSRSWLGNFSNVIENDITGSIVFINCTFEDDVLAYLHDDKSEYTFVANFEKDVVFKNCNFKKGAAFKYSEFDGMADFSGSKIKKEANFKYAEFNDDSYFTNMKFSNLANFKYAEFDDNISFSGTLFDGEADFKYVEIVNGIDLSNTTFNDFLNIKYAEFNGDINLKNFQVNSSMDTKYTTVNGQDFSTYLVNNR